jgi:hypothetical protein
MTRRYLIAGLALLGGLALASVAVAAAWIARQPETLEHCIERFEKLLAEGRGTSGRDPRDARVQPVFTYDVTHMEDVLHTFVGQGDDLKDVRMTLAHGASGPALEAFYRAETPPDGALFAADDFTLFRTAGTPAPRAATLAEGCREAPPKSRLVHIQWRAMPPPTEAPSAL